NRSEVLLPGMHNIENLCAATAAVWNIATPAAIAQVAKTFSGVPHRIEFIREFNGVKYYNDSIATTPTRTVAGLNSFDRKLIVIAGGYDKLIPFTTLAKPLAQRAKVLILMGATANKIREAVTSVPEYSPSTLEIIDVNDMAEAVNKAREKAADGDVVTLSPACASFDCYQNFEERGEHFRKLVKELQ
ncbi:MAG: cyanophycin synthetase, partial [Oscillospiraceae bacterium]